MKEQILALLETEKVTMALMEEGAGILNLSNPQFLEHLEKSVQYLIRRAEVRGAIQALEQLLQEK